MEDTKTMMQVTQTEKWWRKIGNFVYDYSGPCINAIDVATDILVTREFFMEGRMLFFWISFFILSVAQIFYAGLFVTIYADHLPSKKQMVVFMCVFPFGQLVPLFIWIEAFEFRWLTAILQYLGFHSHALTERIKPPDMDELQWWIQERIRSQGGFIIESFMEAFPESIMQMIAILVEQAAKPLNVFSILFSMTSVASKALMFSYSIDRATFVFNFLCFAADVFGIFSTVSWVFFDPGEESFHLTLLGQIWVWKVVIFTVIFVGATIIVLITLGLIKMLDFCRNDPTLSSKSDFSARCEELSRTIRHHLGACWGSTRSCCGQFLDLTVRQVCGYLGQACSFIFYGTFAIAYGLLIPVAVLFTFGVIVMLLEIGKFSFIPLVFQQLDPGHKNNARLYRPLFRWLTWAPTTVDYELRLAVANHVGVREFLIQNFGLNYEDVRLWFNYPQMKFCVWLLQLKPDPQKELMLELRNKANNASANNNLAIDSNSNLTVNANNHLTVDAHSNITNASGSNIALLAAAQPQNDSDEDDDAVITFKDTKEVEMVDTESKQPKEDADGDGIILTNGDHETAKSPENVRSDLSPQPQSTTENQITVINADTNLDDPIKIGYMHLLAVRPKDLRHFGKASMRYFMRQYFNFMRKLYEEDIYREWYSVNCCGKFMLSIVMVVVFFGIYLFLPCLIFYVVISFTYPIICLIATPWEKVELLQLVLTFGYTGMCAILLILFPRVHRFQHANYHLIGPRKGFWALKGEEGMAAIRKEYVNVITAYYRNQVIKEFFGEITPVMLQFLPEIEEIEDELDINNNKLYLREEPTFDDKLFDVQSVRVHEKLLRDLDILEQHAEYLQNSALKPPKRLFDRVHKDAAPVGH